jgi:hypothetical protein
MKIQFKSEGVHTSLIVNGVNISDRATQFILTQEAGYLPELYIKLSVPHDDIDIELPDGVVVIEKQEVENEAECISADGSD